MLWVKNNDTKIITATISENKISMYNNSHNSYCDGNSNKTATHQIITLIDNSNVTQSNTTGK